MDRLWGLILETSIYASILGISILLVKFILKDKISGKWSYMLWMLLVVKLIMPFGPESSFSIFNKIDVNIPNKEIRYEDIELHKNEKEISDYTYGENANLSLDSTNKEEQSINKPQINEDINNKSFLPTEVIPLIWMGGFIIYLFLFIVMQVVLEHQLKRNKVKNNKNIDEILLHAKTKMKIKSSIKIMINDSIRTPALCNLIKPKILFPYSMVDLKNDEIEYILLHELSHYKRKDIFVNYLLIVLQCVHWFNPLIWYFFKKIKEDMELATDEMVVSILNEEKHKEYARTIIALIERVNINYRHVGVLGMADDKKILKKRINMIKKAKMFKSKKNLISTIGILCILITGGLFLTSKKENESLHIKSNFESLSRQKNPNYLGDVSNTLITLENNLDKLTYRENLASVSIENDKAPYKFTINYALGKSELSKEEIERELFINTSLIFSLIENIDYIDYNIINDFNSDSSLYTISFNRSYIEQSLDLKKLYEYSENDEKFEMLLKKLAKFRKGSKNLDEAISNTIKDLTSSSFYDGELVTEAHKVIGQETQKDKLKVYLISNRSSFGFENESFTIVSGEANIPRYIEFLVEDGYYYMIDYKEVKDGSLFDDSIKSIFPMNLWGKAMNSSSYYDELHKEEIKQAKHYLKSIGRDDNATDIISEPKSIDISIEAQNKLLEVEEIQSYPTSWIGSREEVILGIRYLYKSSIKEDIDGYKIVIFEKYNYPDELMEEHHYKVYDDDIKEIKHNIILK